jgi:AcrR family transcriptional regulator
LVFICHPYGSVWFKEMPAPTRTPRAAWIEAGLRALASGGPDAVRIEALAQALGVSKGGFYWAFDGRRALLDEMLETWERLVIDDVIEAVEAGGGDARSRLRHLFALAGSSTDLMSTELAIRDWARRDPAVARRLERIDTRRMDYMRSLFGEFSDGEEDAEARAMLAFSVFIGSHFIAADHGPRTRSQVLGAAMKRLLA